MRLIAVFFLIGTLSIQLFQTLPTLLWVSVLLCSSLLMTIFIRQKSIPLKNFMLAVNAFLFGFLFASFVASQQLNKQLEKRLEGKDIIVQGRVSDIPNYRKDGVRFRFTIQSAKSTDENAQAINLSGNIRLGWYRHFQELHSGETWQLRIRLKRPTGFMNAGGFDYEKWLFTSRIIGTGYIRKPKHNENKKLEDAPWWSLNHLRENIHNTIQNSVENKPSAAVLSALVVAVRNKLDDKQWKALQLTGTSHLVAISGLHISVVAGFAVIPLLLLLRLFPSFNERIPKRMAAGVVAIIFATAYAMLAGFTLPTQRALLMVIIGVIGLLSRQNYSSTNILAAALLGVLLLDPLAGMTISFWLSFLAVGLILIFIHRQINKPLFSLIKLQLVLSLGMLPLTLFFFGSASLTSPIANLIAIPWVSIIVVPLSLLGMLFIPISSIISGALFSTAALAIEWMFTGLSWLAETSLAQLSMAQVPSLYLLIAFLGILFLLLPKGFPARWLGLIALIPALTFTAEKPQQGEFQYTLLDVGQGMASVLQTENHTLVYDTGTRISESFDIGKLVVVPYLRSKGIGHLDQLIISHEDMDHRGGAKAVMDAIKVDKVISSDTEILEGITIEACLKGRKWQWDGVDFEFLSPPEHYPQSDNNRACVLRVSNSYHSLLLTADIEKYTEKRILETIKTSIRSEVMTMPHHGSKTSSSPEFIDAVLPQFVLISAGYRNRFGHPKDTVLKRYDDKNIKWLNTRDTGAIEVYFPANRDSFTTSQYRQKHQGFWNRR